jgi:hypothetical protein
MFNKVVSTVRIQIVAYAPRKTSSLDGEDQAAKACRRDSTKHDDDRT